METVGREEDFCILTLILEGIIKCRVTGAGIAESV